jgi:hypothetical protein
VLLQLSDPVHWLRVGLCWLATTTKIFVGMRRPHPRPRGTQSGDRHARVLVVRIPHDGRYDARQFFFREQEGQKSPY